MEKYFVRFGVAVIGAVLLACFLPFFSKAYAVDGSLMAGSSSLLSAEEAQETSVSAPADSGISVYRLCNPKSGEHLYTTDSRERNALIKARWRNEGVGWIAPEKSTIPVYRLHNKISGEHHYTTDANERNTLGRYGWNYEGIGWYSADGSTPRVGLYREFNPNLRIGTHNYTLDSNEHNVLVKGGWKAEGVAWYALPTAAQLKDGWIYENNTWHVYAGGKLITNSWLVTPVCPPITKTFGPQRYWIGVNGALAINRAINPSNLNDKGAGYNAFATSSGSVVRGKYDNGKGRVYLADNDGRLVAGSGWIVTKKYDGHLERYYIDGAMHAAYSGSFTVSGKKYWGVAGQGYVLRNASMDIGGQWYQANNDGVLTADKQVNSMLAKAQGYSSDSRYLLMIDIDNPRFIVFEGSRGKWKIKHVWQCDTGRPSTPTIRGVYKLGLKGYSFGEDRGFSCYYWSQISGDYLIHTRIYRANTRILNDGPLGRRCSDGCVRLADENAYWVWTKVPRGTTIVTTY